MAAMTKMGSTKPQPKNMEMAELAIVMMVLMILQQPSNRHRQCTNQVSFHRRLWILANSCLLDSRKRELTGEWAHREVCRIFTKSSKKSLPWLVMNKLFHLSKCHPTENKQCRGSPTTPISKAHSSKTMAGGQHRRVNSIVKKWAMAIIQNHRQVLLKLI